MRKRQIRSLVAVALLTSATIAAANPTSVHTATVLETMDGGGYTYVKVDEGGEVFWAAAPASKVAVGDQVSFTEQMTMENFTSNSLGRTFDQLMFVGGLRGDSGTSEAPQAVPVPAPAPAPVTVSEPIEKAEGGYTIAEVFAQKDALKGKTIRVRGKVVKVSRKIMGLNWVHLKDGSGEEGSDRLIFRSDDGIAEVGSVVTAEGTVDTDLDFGYGYRYAVLVNNATFFE